MFPIEIDLARTLNEDRERDAARRHTAGTRTVGHEIRRRIGTVMVAIGNRLIPAAAESPPRPTAVSNC